MISYAEKKRLALQRKQIFNQGIFLGGAGRGAKLFGELCVLENILATPLRLIEKIVKKPEFDRPVL